jgi:hypothetical protein
VVELQRDVQALKAAKGSAGGFEAAARETTSENEFLMQARRSPSFSIHFRSARPASTRGGGV